jgi:MYXO-CTERM domain-containing protein
VDLRRHDGLLRGHRRRRLLPLPARAARRRHDPHHDGRLRLSADGTSWELLHATKDFSIWGTDDDDDYEVETELVSGYSTGLYDVLVELYDSDTGEFLDEFGPNESPDFTMLPLEDSGRDGIVVTQPPVTIINEDGGGGAVSWFALAGLAGALALRRRRFAA